MKWMQHFAAVVMVVSCLLVLGGNADNCKTPVTRGGTYMGQTEKFNRYYTDSSWTPLRTLYVKWDGTNTNLATNTRSDPAPVQAALDGVTPGDKVVFIAGTYSGCYEVGASGTYDQPIVLYGERSGQDLGVTINCCASGRQTCINIEFMNYVAVDGFILKGGKYGVRIVGGPDCTEAPSDSHQVGSAVLNCDGGPQNNDPFFTGATDWCVFENNKAHDAGSGDGHGLYISNGPDFCIVRFNDLYHNYGADFQINADPNLCCNDVNSALCDGSALNNQGTGVAEYMLIEGNYFHNGSLPNSSGPNFTSVRKSYIRYNIIGFYSRHGTSFWQETSNPELGSYGNKVENNLFIGTTDDRHLLQFIVNSDRNVVTGNILLALNTAGTAANPNAILVEVDSTTLPTLNFSSNYYVKGKYDGYTPNPTEFESDTFNVNWFTNFPTDAMGQQSDYTPTNNAPFSKFGGWLPIDKSKVCGSAGDGGDGGATDGSDGGDGAASQLSNWLHAL